MAAEPRTHVAFPQSVEDFEHDERVSFSRADNKWTLENDDGSEWEWDEIANRWMPTLDEALLEQQSKAYAAASVDDNTPAISQDAKKRKKNGEDDTNGSKKPKQNHPSKERKNTAVYVTNLPLDVTTQELFETFSKYGVIAEEIDSGAPRIKLYYDDEGKPKGDALVVYFRPESVGLAIQMLDDSSFRIGDSAGSTMRVKEADMSYKKQKENADCPPAAKGQSRRQAEREKQKIIKRTEKLNARLADWSDDEDPSTLASTSGRWDKVVVLKHMFTLEELAEDPAAILDIKEDIREECEKLGPVTNVILYDKEEEGVATVRFANKEAANGCVRTMNGRLFGGQSVVAYIATGQEKFSKTKEKKANLQEEDDEGNETKRLDEFGAWLENGGDKEGEGPGGGEEIR